MIEDIVRSRSINEVVHFTTDNGLIGILDSRYLRSRNRIAKDQRLEYILKNNTSIRRDMDWLDYVNLSITNINKDFFRSSTGWHMKTNWRILSFSSDILSHPGVEFCTTNNVYPVVLRGQGEEGLERLFAKRVSYGYYGSAKIRNSNCSPESPTDVQAEVLYPGELSIEFLQRIYVVSEVDQDDVNGLISALNVKEVEVIVAPEKFEIK